MTSDHTEPAPRICSARAAISSLLGFLVTFSGHGPPYFRWHHAHLSLAPSTTDLLAPHAAFQRSYFVHIPASAAKATSPLPLLLYVHGQTETAKADLPPYAAIAEREGFAIVSGQGLGGHPPHPDLCATDCPYHLPPSQCHVCAACRGRLELRTVAYCCDRRCP